MNKTLTMLSMVIALMISGCASHKAEVEHKTASEEKAATDAASHENIVTMLKIVRNRG